MNYDMSSAEGVLPMSNTPSARGRGRPAKALDNTVTRRFCQGFWTASEMVRTFPETDNILAGVLALRAAGDTNTRGLARRSLFRVLSWTDSISVRTVQGLLGPRYSERLHQRYTEAARVASRAMAAYIATLSPKERERSRESIRAAQMDIDAPYAADAKAAEARCKPWSLPPLPAASEGAPGQRPVPAHVLRNLGWAHNRPRHPKRTRAEGRSHAVAQPAPCPA